MFMRGETYHTTTDIKFHWLHLEAIAGLEHDLNNVNEQKLFKAGLAHNSKQVESNIKGQRRLKRNETVSKVPSTFQ